MTIEENVAAHYARSGLGNAILAAAEATGADPQHLRVADLAPIDEFHIGGIEATRHFMPKLGIARGTRWLDIGAGIGGPARHVVDTYGCRVTGIDLTPDFCAAATMLTERVGLGDRAEFRQGSALAMPFDAAAFDGAFTIHVAMNIEDKPALYREVHRVLKPGAIFGIYDILAGPATAPLAFPVPWATTEASSFLATIDAMRTMLDVAGFDLLACEDRMAFARDFFEKLRQQAASGPPPLGLHIVMGETFKEKIANMVRNVSEGRCGPWEIVCRKR